MNITAILKKSQKVQRLAKQSSATISTYLKCDEPLGEWQKCPNCPASFRSGQCPTCTPTIRPALGSRYA